MNRLIEFDTVRVVALVGSAESHLAVSGADRPPQVGDLGTVIQLAPTTDPDDPATRYIVECGDDARPIWIAEFGRNELALESAVERSPFEKAVEAFGKFLAQEGWSSSIVWRRPDDVVRRIGKCMVVRRRSSREANAWARRYYESGLGQGLGIAFSAECEIDGAVCATIFWTADEEEAIRLMMPVQGLKMSAALPRALGRSVSWLEWWLARKRLELFHKALAAEGARYRSRNP